MGGTSTDVALIQDGVPLVSSRAGTRIRDADPCADGRRAHHRRGRRLARAAWTMPGMLHVGPESAGASPGPICFGRGGLRPTITDANLVLGRLNPAELLSVQRPVPIARMRELHRRARWARRWDSMPSAAAAAILRIANDKMAGAIRMVSLARGHDPRDFALFAFGGAGPLHAAALARELGIPRVLIPARPGLTNALGCVGGRPAPRLRAHRQPAAGAAPRGTLARSARSRRSPKAAPRIAREHVAVERDRAAAPRRHAVPGPEPPA